MSFLDLGQAQPTFICSYTYRFGDNGMNRKKESPGGVRAMGLEEGESGDGRMTVE